MTSYPGAIPSLPRPGGATTMDAPGYTGSGIIDGISDELEAIATELGTDPSGASATVKARLDAVDTALAGKETAGAAASAYAAAVAASQPLDSDLTAIAALSTTTFGRSLLTLADAAAGRTALGLGTAATSSSSAFDAAGAAAAAQAASQPLDSDLTAIAALTTTSFGRALLTLADAAAGRTTLGLGDSATKNVGTTTGTVAAGDDSRLSDARTPTAHASTHLDNGSDPIATFTSTRSGAVPASGGGTTNFLRADGTFAAPGGGSADGALLKSNTAPPTGGVNGDTAVVLVDSSDTPASYLWTPKTAGAWAATLTAATWGPDGEVVPLPYRHKSQKHSALMPGWATLFDSTWMTGSAPTDMYRSAAFGGAFYSTASGTKVYIGRSKQGTTAMPFFSMECDVTTLPEATRFAWMGQFGYSGAAYGYAARVDSAGVVQLWRLDGVYGDARIGTGTFTIAAGDSIVMERFGYRISLFKLASGTRDLVSSFDSKVRNSVTSGYDGFAYIYGAQSYGYMTDSTSVRIGRLEFAG